MERISADAGYPLSRPCHTGDLQRQSQYGLIIAHNHPSNDPTPSAEDIIVTKTLVKTGKLLEIEVLDHMVVCQNRYVSLKERGLGFE